METEDLRATANTEGEGDVNPTSTKRHILLPLINSSFIPGHGLEAVQGKEEEKTKDKMDEEVEYITGDRTDNKERQRDERYD